jgi:hypothetical protein
MTLLAVLSGLSTKILKGLNATLTMMLGKAVVKWAADLRGNKPPITVSFTPKKKRVRPAFEHWEY